MIGCSLEWMGTRLKRGNNNMVDEIIYTVNRYLCVTGK